jgi:GNAT superfamily N-acetyltransferase
MPDCECGLLYASWHPPDVRLHRRVHDEYLKGTPAPPYRDDEVIAHDPTTLVVRPGASWKQRDRAMRIARRANREMHYDFGAASIYDSLNTHEFQTHAFFAVREGRAVAFVVLEKRSHVWLCRWSDREDCEREHQAGRDYNPPMLSQDHARWTVIFVWTLPAMRRQAIARRLIEQAAQFAGIPIAELGWYTPFSETGETLVRNLCPDQYLVIK